MEIGKIQRLKLREVWKHEALDFTTWLEENVDVINDALDLNLVNLDREQSAGKFSVDLVGEDKTGNLVVIENQLGRRPPWQADHLPDFAGSQEGRLDCWRPQTGTCESHHLAQRKQFSGLLPRQSRSDQNRGFPGGTPPHAHHRSQ